MIFMCLKSIYMVSSDSGFYTLVFLLEMTSALTPKVSQHKALVMLQLKDDSVRFRNI